jgi:glycosyltransferase involved in cell wall biosynthesis
MTGSETLETAQNIGCQSSPKVSVCIPAYQAERYLRATVDSVLAQDYADLELVVVDNNSTDGTSDILAGVTDDRVRIIRNATTVPAVDNFNCAVQQTRGEFVKLICADDTLTPDCIGQQVAVLEGAPGVVLVAAKTHFIDEHGELVLPARGLGGLDGRLPADRVIKRVVHSGGNPIGAPVAVMFRRADFDRCGGFDTDLPFLADLDLWVRLLRCGDFVGLPRTLGSFRIRSESVSGLTKARTQLDQHIAFDRRVADDPRWDISVADRIHGRVRCYEHVVRRTLLFGLSAWRASRRSSDSDASPVPKIADRGGLHNPAADPQPAETLSVVICAYTMQRWVEVCQAVESVLAQDFRATELILVIDHCPELFLSACARFGGDERLTVLENAHERGLSGARNTGVGAARGDVVAFVDDDAVAEPGWARALMRHYVDGRVAGVGGYASPVWPDGRPAWMPKEFDWVVGCSYTGQPTELASVRNPLGCNMSMRRSVFDVVGGFSAEVGRIGSHPVGGEETELCIRIGASQPSSEILFDPEARVQHHVSRDRVSLRYFFRRCYHEGMSKAVVTELANAPKALSTERAYTFNVLPRAMAREFLSMTFDGFARAAVMLLGLVLTAAGYANAKARRRLLSEATH